MPLFFSSHGLMAILRFLQKWMKLDCNRIRYKNHFNFRLHVEIDTIKQTDKNNDHIHRNKTNKPVSPSLHSFTGNTHFCSQNATAKAWNLFWTPLILKIEYFYIHYLNIMSDTGYVTYLQFTKNEVDDMDQDYSLSKRNTSSWYL